jgi:hypothetical protein
MSDEVGDSRKRVAMKPVFLIVPSILSGVFFLLFLVLKLVEKVPNGFMRWGWVFGLFFIFGLVCFGISVAIYLLVSMKDSSSGERRFNSRERCDVLIRQEIRRRTGYNLSDFSETGDSTEGVIWAGVGSEKDKDKIYFHLYRIQKGALKRYFLGVQNLQVGREDDLILVQSPLNFSDLDKLILDSANKLCRNPVKVVTKESVFKDEVSGRSRVDKEESPLDKPENGDVEFEEVRRE